MKAEKKCTDSGNELPKTPEERQKEKERLRQKIKEAKLAKALRANIQQRKAQQKAFDEKKPKDA